MAKSYEPETKLHNLIGSGTKIIGNIETTESIRIDGEIEGNIASKGKVVIGAKGKVKGEVNCLNSEIEGALEGKVMVKELLSLKATSKLVGDIETSKLTIEPGAVFTGKCQMGGSSGMVEPQANSAKK
ncbi:bactofilin family protein [Saccharicrinis fermentans]|uniref:Polymer-forming cytoskeletal n=1 Tax=Saccharicrinis fermentans DSM 9555 = JCM 21142 TaxID=869213 RepID=W7Y332_9BACT|nr:polymer-forming cytoskeletal protein [Saccharicrinis fermentans]GAF02412.1 polymer-forming cytoskeletal [Saccharicrinis fermentans DSM 9555 = JCM 21142]